MFRAMLKFLGAILCGAVFFSATTWATSLDKIDQFTLMINKLERVHKGLPVGNATRVKIGLRLADLHSERSRNLDYIGEHERVAEDREKALYYYNTSISKLPEAESGAIYIQMGHLYNLLGDSVKAQRFYSKVAKKNTREGAEALLSIAEIRFNKKQYKEAKLAYEKALKNKNFPRRGLAEFRLSWCEYYQGAAGKAARRAERILKTPSLLNRSGRMLSGQIDEDFQAEISRDYIRFLVDSESMKAASIDSVYKYSPKEKKETNLIYLAKELERLGQNQNAEATWNYLTKKTRSEEYRTEAYVALTQLLYKQNKKEKILPVLKDIKLSAEEYLLCESSHCTELLSRLEKTIFDWHRTEKKKPTAALLEAYEVFSKITPKAEAKFLAVEVAASRSEFKKAYKWSTSLISSLQKKLKKSPGEAKLKSDMDRALLKRIEIAELMKDKNLLAKAQESYLEMSPLGTKKHDVKYQMAYQKYEAGEYSKAAEAFYTLANAEAMPKSLRLKSADLAIDSLALLKDHKKIQMWSLAFSKSFPEKAKEYGALKNKSTLSYVADLSARKKGADWAKIQKSLEDFDLDSASEKEAIIFHRNVIIVSQKLKEFKKARYHVDQLLKIKSLEKKDREFALANGVHLAELGLDFKTAYDYQLDLNKIRKEMEPNWLKLALLADLSGQSGRPYLLKQFVKAKTKAEKTGICLKLSEGAKHWKEIDKNCQSYLLSNKDALARVLVQTYTKSADKESVKIGLSHLKNHPLGTFFWRRGFWERFETAYKKLKEHKINGSGSQTVLVKGIKRRSKLLDQFEALVGKSVKEKDWMSQVVSLSALSSEMNRMHQDLISLPSPAGLTPEEQQQYTTILSQQAAPFQSRAQNYEVHLQGLWKKEGIADSLRKTVEDSKGFMRSQLLSDVERVQETAPEEKKPELLAVMNVNLKEKKILVVDRNLLEKARMDLQKSPFSKDKLMALASLERKRNNMTMVEYLELRMKNEKKEK